MKLLLSLLLAPPPLGAVLVVLVVLVLLYWYSHNSYSYPTTTRRARPDGSGAAGRCHYLCTTTCMTDNSNAYIFTHRTNRTAPTRFTASSASTTSWACVCTTSASSSRR